MVSKAIGPESFDGLAPRSEAGVGHRVSEFSSVAARWPATPTGPGDGLVGAGAAGPEVGRPEPRRVYAVAKRSFDLVLASVLLVLMLPFWGAFALAIVTTSPGPALFRQRRCGRRGQPFTCFKFRTMSDEAEAILRADPSLRDAFAGTWKLGDDPRVTRVGRWLRKTSLDELPQLLNILKGEMSFVGPRPVQPNELGECYGAVASTVFDVMPGLTGLWQVSGRSNLNYDQRVALDLEYVRRRGFWFDCQIVLRTVPAILLARGGTLMNGPVSGQASDLGGRRVLIAGINYWPEETGNAPYTAGLAEHLAARGAEVTVLTGMPYYPQWSVPAGYRGRLWSAERHNGVEIRRLRQYVPTRQSAARRALCEATYLAHALRLVALPRPEVVLGVMPMVSGGVIAATAAARYRVPFGLVIQDLSGQAAAQTGIKGGGSVAGAAARGEGWVARRAAGVAIVAEGFRPHLEAMGVDPTRIRRVRNWTHIGRPGRGPAETRARLGIPADAWVCLHAGNMGLKQGLENVVDAARLASERHPDFRFVFVGDGNQRTSLEARAAGLPNVLFRPPEPEETFPDVLASADVLLVNQRPTVVDMCLPGKLTSYLAAGRSVVAAVAPGSETARELGHAGAGVVVPAGQPAALLEAITDLEADRARAAELGRRGQVFAHDHLTAGAGLRVLEEFVIDVAARRVGVQAPVWSGQPGD